MPAATAVATKPVVFMSKYPDLRIVRIAQERLYSEGGRRVGDIAPGSPQNEKYGIVDDGAPWEIQFVGGVFSTADPILIDYLRNHKPFDSSDDSGDRSMQAGGYNIDFWEQGRAPDEARPTIAEQTKLIGRMGALADEPGLKKLIKDEKASHNRTAVIQGAESALEALAEIEPPQGYGSTEGDNGGSDGADEPAE
jgi:hypothetical protein